LPVEHRLVEELRLRAFVGGDFLECDLVDGFFTNVDEESKLYTDGSVAAPLEPYARAAGAIVQVTATGKVVRAITFVVPRGWPRTAAAAEFLAFILGARFNGGGLPLVTDCQAVWSSAVGGPRVAMHPKKPWAAVWADFDFSGVQALKVKAHLSLQQAEAIGQSSLWAGNQHADSAAKRAAKEALPSEFWCKALDAVATSRRAFLRGAAQVLAAYPRPVETAEPAASKRVEAVTSANLVLIHGHEFATVPGTKRWICLRCSLSCGNSRKEGLATARCASVVPVIAGVVAGARVCGHMPRFAFAVGSRLPVVCCVRCGSHTEGGARVVGLARQCPASRRVGAKFGAAEALSKGARYRLGRFLRGLHPVRNLSLDGPFAALPSDVLWRAREAWPPGPFAGGSAAVGACFSEAWADGPMDLDCDDDPWPEGPGGLGEAFCDGPWPDGPPDLALE